MAGKTLPGIGEDESGEHDAGDTSDSGLSDSGLRAAAGMASARSTDRMPLALPASSSFSGPTVVDDDKVAEGLKKLRSLDEPLGPMPMTAMPSTTIQPGTMPAMGTPPGGMPSVVTPASSMPTLKEGMPVVGAAPPPVTPAVAAAELLRSRGTAHGHALSGPGGNPALLPINLDERMKGTLLGHTLHLPDIPEPSEEKPRAAEVRSIAVPQQVPPAGMLRPSETVADFSNGDSRFFDSQTFVTEPAAETPRPNLMFRGVVFFAVVSVFGVAAFAWVNARKGDSAEAQATTTAEPAPPAPTAPAEAAPAAAAPSPPPAAAVAPAAAVPATAPPVEAVAPPEPAPVAIQPPPESPTSKLKREVAAVSEAKAPRPATHVPTTRPVRHTDSTRDVPSLAAKPTPTPTPTSKHAKTVDDPDGTLPLSD